jgi:hypothetical protein
LFAGIPSSTVAENLMATKRRCSVGLHRWTTKGGNTVTCFDCGTSRPRGKKRFRCYLGRHRWLGVKKDGGEPYRECFFCRKYSAGSPTYQGPVGTGS